MNKKNSKLNALKHILLLSFRENVPCNVISPTFYSLFAFPHNPQYAQYVDNIWDTFSPIDTGRVNTVGGRLQC